MPQPLIAGAAAADITPKDSQFLFGYPHFKRYSEGTHDRLMSSAMYLATGDQRILFIANDIIYITKEIARRVRQQIEQKTGVPAANITISATHTHSGPITVDTLSNEADAIVPKTDPKYVAWMEEGILNAAVAAVQNARPAEIGFARANGTGVGTNRHDPAGPADLEVPVVLIRDASTHANLGAMIVCCMHPTVLHEDSMLASGDFPAMARQYLQEHLLGKSCPVLHHTGPAGDQSPRHVTRANTFDEATRIGGVLGQAVAKAIETMTFTRETTLGCVCAGVDLPPRPQPSIEWAKKHLVDAVERLDRLRRTGADPRETRTAECDWFGAEETVALARAAAEGRVDQAIAAVLPAEVIVMQVGPWFFASWPGEVFIEFSLMVRKQHPNCYVISLANGELQGYLATEQAAKEGWYEAMNSVFKSPEAGMRLVDKTLELLGTTHGQNSGN